MVKGINQTVIEIVDTGNELFERAILFVKPAGSRLDQGRLETGARRFLRGVRIPRRILPRRGKFGAMIGYTTAILAGAGLTLLAQFLLNGGLL